MVGCTIIKLSMIYHIRITIPISESRVMPLCQFTQFHGLPLITTHQLFTIISRKRITVVHFIAWVNGTFFIRILIRTINIFGTENTHLISAVRRIEAVGHKQEPVISNLFHISTLTGYIRTTGNLCSKIFIRCDCCYTRIYILIVDAIVTETRFLIQLDGINTTRPGTINQPKISIFIIRHTRVDGMRPDCSPGLTHIILRRQTFGFNIRIYKRQVRIHNIYLILAIKTRI